MNTETWQLTDGSLYQYGRKISEGHYEFREFDRNNYLIPEGRNDDEFIDSVWDDSEFWVEQTIIMSDYTEKQIDNYISGYYDNVDEVKGQYDDDWECVVAECIFEQESGLY